MSEIDYNKLSNPLFFKENRLEAHSDHKIYASKEEYSAENSSLTMSLNGRWKFSYAVNNEEAVHGFEALTYDVEGWDEITVPAHIQLAGNAARDVNRGGSEDAPLLKGAFKYDRPHYTNMTYPWEEREHIVPGQVPTEYNPVGSYVRFFCVPENMRGNRILIRFEGVESCCAVWLNGHYVGYTEDSFSPAEFDLTPYIAEGENRLAVRVWKWCAGSWCEDQDFFRFSGIYRDVKLVAIPKVHVWDMHYETKLSDDYRTAQLNVALNIFGKGKIKYRLYELGLLKSLNPTDTVETLVAEAERCAGGSGSAVAEAEGLADNVSSEIPANSSDGTTCCEECFSVKIDKPLLWSAELPNLYRLEMEVQSEGGAVTEYISQFVGFRRFEMKDGIMCLNGKRIVFKGVNRHEFSDIRGRVPSFTDALKDIVTMKQNNINAIRTSHYPDASYIYELCDMFGIYLIAENNMETHGTMGGYPDGTFMADELIPNNHAEWQPLLLDRVRSLFETRKNHPAILIWSCGNESCGGSVIYEMSKLFRSLDKGRLVHYEGIMHDRSYNATSDMESQMYTSVEGVKAFLKENPDKPFIMCEYTHAMGNSCGAMYKYMALADTEPRFQGGFIWDYIDQSLLTLDRYGHEFQAYGGDFDDRPNDGDFSGDGICYAHDREPSPKMQEVKYCYSNIEIQCGKDSFTVVNKNLFANTDIYGVEISLLADGEEVACTDMCIAVAPGDKKEFEYPDSIVESMLWPDTEYCINVSFATKEDSIWARSGHEVAFGQKIYKIACEKYVCNEPLEVIIGHADIIVKGSRFKAMFSASGMSSYVFDGLEMLDNVIAAPNFWRAPTANDRGNMQPWRYGQWKLASLYASAARHPEKGYRMPKYSVNETSCTVSYRYWLPTTPESECEVCYTIYGDGYVEVNMAYDPVEGLQDMPEFGMMFTMSADYDRLKWYGLGPMETYVDRCMGGKLGIYSNMVADNMAKYLTPQECGNKCGVRYALVYDKNGRGMCFKGDEMSFSALPYTPHELENARHDYELPEVHHTVVRASLMQMGIAGDDSWGAKTHPEHLIDVTKKIEFSFSFIGI